MGLRDQRGGGMGLLKKVTKKGVGLEDLKGEGQGVTEKGDIYILGLFCCYSIVWKIVIKNNSPRF